MWRTTSVVLALSLTACAASRADGAESTTSTSRPEQGEPVAPGAAAEPDTPADDVLAALDGFVRSTIAVNDPPDPDHPDLARFRTGAVLQAASEAVARNRMLGISYRLPEPTAYTHVPSLVSLEPDRAVVRDCIVDDARQVVTHDAQVLNDGVATKLFETTLVLVDGQWKVAENSLIDRWEGVAGCAGPSPRR